MTIKYNEATQNARKAAVGDMTMKMKYASIIATIDGVDCEVVDKRQPCDAWAETFGDTITIHLVGDAVGPITRNGAFMRIAIYADETGGEWLATMPLLQSPMAGCYVQLA